MLKRILIALALLVPTPAYAVLDDLHQWSTTAASNTDVGGISLAEGMQRASVNNAMREIMAELRRGVANKGTDISSVGGAPAICATGTSVYVDITGTTTITSFGTANAGCWRILQFDGALTLTHNATSLILLGGANVTTAAGYVGGFISEGSGNWRQVFGSHVPYLTATNTFTAAQAITSTATGTLLTITSTEAGAANSPNISLYRNSATPAANDVGARLQYDFEDSAGNTETIGTIYGTMTDPTNGSEDGGLQFESRLAGAINTWSMFGGSFHYATLAQKEAGSVNSTGVYVNGHGTLAQFVSDTDNTYTTAGTILPLDDTIPQNTEGDEILSVAITPTNASSTLIIESLVNVSETGVASLDFACAVFVDTTADAIYAAPGTVVSSNNFVAHVMRHQVSAGSTSARTYKIRCGSAVATDIKINGNGSARLFGGVEISSLKVTEILPQ
jgi:hypothetical protein